MSKSGQLLEDKWLVRGWGARHLIALALLAPLFSVVAFADSASETYKSKCSACHGTNGTAETMLGKNLRIRALASNDVQKQSDEQLFSIISHGRDKMPAFDTKLSPEQIRGLVRHIRSLKK